MPQKGLGNPSPFSFVQELTPKADDIRTVIDIKIKDCYCNKSKGTPFEIN